MQRHEKGLHILKTCSLEARELEETEPLTRQMAGRARKAADSCSSRYSPAVLRTCQLLISKTRSIFNSLALVPHLEYFLNH